MRKHLYFNPLVETKKAYLTRAAALLDILRNHPGLTSSHPLLAGITNAEIREFENYLCNIIKPDVEKAAYLAARKSEILDYKDIIINLALASVMEVLHTYNSPTTVMDLVALALMSLLEILSSVVLGMPSWKRLVLKSISLITLIVSEGLLIM